MSKREERKEAAAGQGQRLGQAAGKAENGSEEKEIQELETIIVKAGDTFAIPKGLLPENMAEKLTAYYDRKMYQRKKKRYIRAGIAAAMCALLLTGGIMAYHNQNREIVAAHSYEEVYHQLLEEKKAENYQYYGSMDGASVQAAGAAGTYAMKSIMASGGASENSAGGYSTTNVQVEGIQEADSVVTDGKYIYVGQTCWDLGEINKKTKQATMVQLRQLRIFQIENGQSRLVSKTNLSEQKIPVDYYDEAKEEELIYAAQNTAEEQKVIFYIQGDVLAAYDIYQETDEKFYQKEMTRITFYDISDRTQPKKRNSLVQSGTLLDSRLEGEYLYTVSQDDHINLIDQEEEARYLPQADGKSIPSEDIYMNKNYSSGCAYTLATVVSLSHPDRFQDSKAVVGRSYHIYMSKDNLYLFGCPINRIDWDLATCGDEEVEKKEKQKLRSKTDRTMIVKISYQKERLAIKGVTVVRGSMGDRFVIDEKDGYLRMVMTVHYIESGSTDNAVYVLDGQMDLCGKITGIAREEEVYSARYLGKMGYFVTYRDTDPLFSVDFSDPKNPRLAGELKLPGFSEYLHFYNDKLLLGIGQDEEKDCMKLSMYDVSDPKDVKEKDVCYLPKNCYSPALQEYKSVLVDLEHNLFGFELLDGRKRKDGYVLYTYTDSGFKQVFYDQWVNKELRERVAHYEWGMDISDSEAKEPWEPFAMMEDRGTRGIRIGDYLYIVYGYKESCIRISHVGKILLEGE